MKTRMMLVLGLVVAATFATATPTQAQGTVGVRLINIYFNRVELKGDLEEFGEFLDDINAFGVALQLPLGKNFEILANATYSKISGKMDVFTLDAPVIQLAGGARFNFLPDAVFNPFIAGAYSITKQDVEIKANGQRVLKDDDTDNAITLSAGAEVALGERAALVASFSRAMPQSSDRDFDLMGADDDRDSIAVGLSFWATDTIVLGANYVQELENDTQTFGVSLGFHF